MDNQMEMRATREDNPSSKEKTSLSKNMIIGIILTISAGLAIGLGVGLGVGLNNVDYREVIKETTKAPTSKPAITDGVIPHQTTEVITTPEETTAAPSNGSWQYYRLPLNIKPTHYKLLLHPNMTTNDYTGTNEIHFYIFEDAEYVILHAHETLEITNVALHDATTDDPITITRTFRYPANEFFVIQPEKVLRENETFVLQLDFYNRLDQSRVGIYKATYIDPSDGEEKGIVGSHMEPTDARRAYPCFDEPALKIRYTTTIIHEARHNALSNMPVNVTEEIENGLMCTVFEESVPMSTYLGCFVVGEFKYKEVNSSRGIPLRIYGTKYQIDRGQLDYALDITKDMFDKYEDLFKMNYSLPKYDQIAIPNFGTGAMENWGLVTYRERYLLWDPEESSTADRQLLASVVAHELVHQWFGNIVTMKWWGNIWLNEGFATYLSYQGLKWAESDWIVEGHHVVDDVQRSMRADSLNGSHPIVVNVESPSEIKKVFDVITYQKGSSILKMMNDILGDKLFFGGLNHYLEEHEFANANEQDLWSSVQWFVDSNGGDFNVSEIMDPWVQQLGFPVVHVDTSSGTEAAVTQDIMLTDANVDADKLKDTPYNYTWNVMLDFYSENNTINVTEGLLSRIDTDVRFDITGFGKWVKFNVKERKFYRVNYNQEVWKALADQLAADITVIDQLDRCHLLDDAFNLALAKKIDYTAALNMTIYLDQEDSFFVWNAFSSGSSYIRNMLANTNEYGNFKSYYLTRVKPIADKLGWNATEGTHEDKRNRPTVLGLALRYDDQEALANATELFQHWKDGKYIHPDIRQLVYIYGILNGNESDWEFMWNKYMEEPVAAEKMNLLRGLAATENVVLIDRLLEYSMNESVIKEQDFFTCITYISYSVNGNAMAWSWVRINWDYLVDRFTLQSRSLGNIIPTIVDNYNTELQKWEVEDFFQANPDGGAGDNGRTNTLTQIDLNIKWMAENKASIGKWLQDRVNEL